jgi:hypothetical protein
MREREELRVQLGEVREELKGLHRQIANYSADRLIIMEHSGAQPSEKAPEASASARRVKDITGSSK